MIINGVHLFFFRPIVFTTDPIVFTTEKVNFLSDYIVERLHQSLSGFYMSSALLTSGFVFSGDVCYNPSSSNL